MIKITLHRLEINIISMFSSFDFSRRLYTREEKVGECLFMVISCISRWEITVFYFQKFPWFGKSYSKLHSQNLYKYIVDFILIEGGDVWDREMGRRLFYFNCLGGNGSGYQFPMRCAPCWGVLACRRHSMEILRFSHDLHMNLVTYNNTLWSNLNLLFSICDKDNIPGSGGPGSTFSLPVRLSSDPCRSSSYRRESTGLDSNRRDCPGHVHFHPIWATCSFSE